MKKRLTTLILALLMIVGAWGVCATAEVVPFPEAPVVGIAWRADTDSEFFTNICRAVEEAGGTWVLLDQVTSADLTYDGAGNCLSRKEIRDGEVFQEDLKTYNEAGLLLSETSTQTLSSDYVVTFVAIYTYDGAGRQLKADNSWTELIDGKTTSSSNSTTTSYDAGGRVLVDETKTSEGNYNRSVYTYDSEGRMLTSSYTDSSGESYSDTYSYDDAGRHVRTETVSPDGATYTTYNYDANGNLVRSNSSDGGYFIGEYITAGANY